MSHVTGPSVRRRIAPTNVWTAIVAIVPALIAGVAFGVAIPSSVLVTRALIVLGAAVTWAWLARQPTVRTTAGTGLYVVALVVLATPLVVLVPVIGGGAPVPETSTVLQTLLVAVPVAALVAAVLVGVGYLLQR